MTTSTIPVALRIRDSLREPTHAELAVEDIPMPKRVMKAAIRLVLLWVLAVACIFIPLLHFVLVPGFAVAGVVFAVLAAKGSVEVKSTEVTCPKCGQVTPIEKGRTGWPVGLWCKKCGTSFSAVPG